MNDLLPGGRPVATDQMRDECATPRDQRLATPGAHAPISRAASARTSKWYVIQVTRGRERTMSELLTRVLPEGALTEPVFQPQFETESKFHGEWCRVRRDLLKGYLVAVSPDAELLQKSVNSVVEFCQVLGTDSGPAPLSAEEVELFGGLGAPGRRCLPMSRGYRLPGGEVFVAEGPLAGREALISDVNRRKSVANLSLEVAGEPVRARAGLALLPVPEDVSVDALVRKARRRLVPRRRAVAGVAYG